MRLVLVASVLFCVPAAAVDEPVADPGFFDRVTAFFSNLTSSGQGEWYADRSLAGFRAYPLIQRALREMESGHYDRANEFLARALEKAPDSAAIWAIRGDLEIRRDNSGLAGDYLEEALNLDPELAQAHLYRAYVRRSYRDYEGAAEDLTFALASGDLTETQQAAASIELAALSDPDPIASSTTEALRLTDVGTAEIVPSQPASVPAPTAASPQPSARITTRPQSSRAAVTVVSALPWIATPPEQKLGDLGYAFVNEGQCFPADPMFQIAFNESTDARFLIARADCYASRGNPDLALEAFEDARDNALSLSPEERTYVSQSLAFLYGQSGDHAAAAEAWETVTSLDPSPENRIGLARALAANGEPTEAFAQLQSISPTQLESEDRASYYSLRADSRTAGDPEGAASDLAEAIAINDSADLRLRRAVLLQRLDRNDAALNELERAYDLDTDNQEISLALAYAYTNAGRDRAAIPQFEAALDNPAGDRYVAQEDLAYAQLRLGERRDAAQSFRRVVDNRDRYPQDTEEQQDDLDERLYRVRREVEMLERTWYAYASAVYRSADINTSGVPQADRNQSQVGAELGWFPLRGRISAARNLGIYARAFGSFEPDTFRLRDESWQAGVGLRLKPFDFTDLVFRGERLIAIGDDARGAWLLSAAHSWGIGGDWRPDGGNWTVANTYLEAAWIPDEPEFMSGTGEFFVGRAFPIARNLALIPHAVGSIRYSEDELVQNTLGEAGLGIGLRYWFDEDTYHAPRGTVDLQLQYRWFVLDDTVLPLSDDGSFVGRLVITR